MNIAWKLIKLGYQRMGDVGKARTLWWLLPSGVTAVLIQYWTAATLSPVAVWIVTILAGVGTFIAVLAAAGYYEMEEWKASPVNFKCDFPTLEKLCLLLAQLEEDATGYAIYSKSMWDRLSQLESYRPLFAESKYSITFQCFYNAVFVGIECKKTHLDQKTREFIQAQTNEHYPILKAALDSDYSKSRR